MSEKLLSRAVLVKIEHCAEYLNMSTPDVLRNRHVDVSMFDDRDYWHREIVYIVDSEGEDLRNRECCFQSMDDDWEYCPYCGERLNEHELIHEEYSTREAAEASEYFKALGIDEFIRFGVRKREADPDKALGAFDGR